MSDLDHLSSHMVQQNARLIEARDRLNAFVEAVPVAIASAQDLMGCYDVRAERLYAQLLDANAQIQKSTEAISGAAGQGVEQLQGRMESVTNQAGQVVEGMLALRQAVTGENGLTAHVKKIENAFGEKVWILDKSINALSSAQISKLAQHEKAVASIKTIVVAALAFCAGGSISSNPWWLGAIGVGVLAVGVVVGWLFAYKKQ